MSDNQLDNKDEFGFDAEEGLPSAMNPAHRVDEWAVLDEAMSGLLKPVPMVVQEHVSIKQKNQPQAHLPDARDLLDQSVLSIFLEDADEQLRVLNHEWNTLSKKDEKPSEKDIQSIKRVIHTFKGNAGMVGASSLADVSHDIESELVAVEESRSPWADVKPLIEDGIHDIKEWVMWIKDASYKPDFRKAESIQAVSSVKEDGQTKKVSFVSSEGLLRLRPSAVDALLKEVGAWGSGQTGMKAQNMALRAYVRGLDESVEQMQRLLREVEISAEAQISARKNELNESGAAFDPLELDRFTRLQEAVKIMSEGVYDLGNVHVQLEGVVKQNDDLLIQQTRSFRSAQETMKELRLVALDSINGKLMKVVALATTESKKKAALEVIGDSSQLDRTVLDRLTPVLEHILRNAIAHGIETPEERVAKGKPTLGKVVVRAESFEDYMVLQCLDDGAGINTVKVKEKAIQLGMVGPHDSIGESDLHQLIFAPGFSTASEVSTLAGRGIGMDVVKTEVEQLGGSVSIQSKKGEGTNFIINVPLTIATAQALMVQANGDEWALPAQHVVQVHSVRDSEVDAKNLNVWRGAPLVHLGDLLSQSKSVTPIESYNTVVEFENGKQKLYVRVDKIYGTDSVVVRPLAAPLNKVVGFGGAAHMGEGRMGLLLQPYALWQQKQKMEKGGIVRIAEPSKANFGKKIKAMIVDDSMTVRKVTGDLLLSRGMQIMLAKDGVDALEQLQAEIPDIILLDLEMPRMNGFEFAEYVRNTPKFDGIPIVMITSRTAEKHQDVAKTLGINAYLGKPYQEHELLAQIKKWTTEKIA